MATEHNTITDPNIHEPRGVASASDGEVYVADGAGSGVWSNPNVSAGFKYGGLYSVDSDAITISSIGTTSKKLEAFANAAPTNGVTVSTSTNDITVSTDGDYLVIFNISFSTTAVGDAGLYQFHVRKNDVEDVIEIHRDMSGSSDTGAASVSGIMSLVNTDVLSVYVESDEAGDSDSIEVESVSFNVILLRET